MAARRYVGASAVEAVLGREHLLQLAVVEEDPAAVLALLDVHALPVDRAHPSLTFRTSHASRIGASGPSRGRGRVSNRTSELDLLDRDRRLSAGRGGSP
jgi:hypothetical protein